MRYDNGIVAAYKMVDTCAAEFEAETPYYYSVFGSENEAAETNPQKKVLVLGSGPIRIGQGIEFDFCSVHCTWAFAKEGYETVITGNGENLSQGQRQLINIARAALSKAPVLVMDEATSSVDTITERQIQEGMDALMKDRTTFVIAHRLSTIRNSDMIMVLEHGRIIERGTHTELLQRQGRYYELYTGKAELD